MENKAQEMTPLKPGTWMFERLFVFACLSVQHVGSQPITAPSSVMSSGRKCEGSDFHEGRMSIDVFVACAVGVQHSSSQRMM